MGSESFAIVGLVVIGIMLAGCVGWPEKGNVTGIEQKPPIINETNTTNVTATNATNISQEVGIAVKVNALCENLSVSKEECIIGDAYSQNNISECGKLNGSYFDRCIYRVAEKGWGACTIFNETEKMDYCLLNSSQSQGVFVCGQISNASIAALCRLGFVSAGCRNISTDSDRYLCDAIAKDNESICANAAAPNTCYLKFSRQKRDVCSLISSDAERTACYGVLSNSPALCENLTAQVKKDLCYKTIAIELVQCELCDNIVTSDPYGDDCYSGCGYAANVSDYCSKLSKEQKRDTCFYNYAVGKGVPSLCAQIKLDMFRQSCIPDVAVKTAEPATCEILDIAYVQSCYTRVITSANVTVESCMQMTPTYVRDQCINNAVKMTKDTSACANIDDASLRDYCSKIK